MLCYSSGFDFVGVKKMQKLMGRKLGMTQRFDESGNVVVCTVIGVEPNVVTQVRRRETEGYEGVQFGFGLQKNLHLFL